MYAFTRSDDEPDPANWSPETLAISGNIEAKPRVVVM